MDIAAAARQTVRMMRPFAEKKDIAIEELLPRRAEIYADEQKIRQLILILVDNAVKYTPEHGHIEVSLSTEERRYGMPFCLQIRESVLQRTSGTHL